MPKERKAPEWTGLPVQRSSAAALKVRLVLVIGVAALAVLSGVASTMAWLSSGGNSAPAPSAPAPPHLGRAVATVAAESYILGVEPQGIGVLPGFEFSSDGISVLSGPTWVASGRFMIGDQLFEQHSFELHRQVGGRPAPYRLDVLVSVDTTGFARPAVAAAPSIRRLTSSVSQGTSIPPEARSRDNPSLPGSARERLSLWASAWAADDSETLKVYTGDPTTGVVYMGLGGYQVANLSVLSAHPVGERWLVRVRMLLDDPILGSFSPSGHRITVDLDVTMEAAASGNPRVVGWGPAGLGIRVPESVREPVTRP